MLAVEQGTKALGPGTLKGAVKKAVPHPAYPAAVQEAA